MDTPLDCCDYQSTYGANKLLMANAFYNIALPYWKAEGLRKDDSMNGGQRRNTLVIEALTRWVANSHGYNHAHSSRFEMSTRKYRPRMAFLPQNTALG